MQETSSSGDPSRLPSVHSTALIESGARIGAGCVIHAHAIITRHCELAENVVVHPFAVLGGEPQDVRFDSSTVSHVRIGARSVIREHVTVNRATMSGAATYIGSDCFLMAASHVAHDCRLGDRVILANSVLLGGHANIGDRAFLGGSAIIHQFCRIGEDAMVGGGGRISRDVAPYCMATERNTVIGLNLVGLRRRGLPRETMRELKLVFRAVFSTLGNPREKAAETLANGKLESIEAHNFLDFFTSGRRGFSLPRRFGARSGTSGDSVDLGAG